MMLTFTQISKAQTCTACFTAVADSLNPALINLDASCSNSSPNANFDWYVDGSLYRSFFPIPYFQVPIYIPGQHVIQLVIHDGACIDSTNQIVNINNCNASFTAYQFGGGAYYFYPNVNIGGPVTYNWDFGDGNTSNASVGNNINTTPGT